MLTCRVKFFLQPEDDSGPQTPPQTFTQEQVNAILAKEKRSLVSKIEELQKRVNLPEADRQALQEQIELIKNEKLTVEQRLTRERDDLKATLETRTKELQAEAESWQKNFEAMLIEREITSAAAQEKAINPELVLDLLRSKARVIRTKDDAGNEKFLVRVPHRIKEELAELEPLEVLRNMKQQTSRYGSLFAGDHVGGSGIADPNKPKKPGSLYDELRKKNK